MRSFHLCGSNQAVTLWSDVRLTAVAGAAAGNPLAFIIKSSNGRRSCRNVGAQASPCCEIALFTEQPLLKKPGITQPFFKLSHSSLRTAAGRCRRVSGLMVHGLWGGACTPTHVCVFLVDSTVAMSFSTVEKPDQAVLLSCREKTPPLGSGTP